MSTTETTESSSESGRSSPQYTVTRRFDDEEWEFEEEEEDNLVEEFREVWQQSHTVTFDDTRDSLDNDNLEDIKTKLRALREYVHDLQSSYEELLNTFAELENAARDRVASLEQQLSAQAQDFQRTHQLLEQEMALLRAGAQASPIDHQTQTDMELVLDEMAQGTADVLATVNDLCTGAIKLRSEDPLSPQTASSSSYIPSASSSEESSILMPSTQSDKEEEESSGLVNIQITVDLPDQASEILNSQESPTVTGDQEALLDWHSSTADVQTQASLGSDRDAKETREQGVQVGEEHRYHQMLEPVEKLQEQGDALLAEKQEESCDYEAEEQGLEFVDQEPGPRGHFPIELAGSLVVHEPVECHVEEDNSWQGPLGDYWQRPQQQHLWIDKCSPDNSDTGDGTFAEELLGKDVRIAELETRVQSLEHELQEARHAERRASATMYSNQEEEVVSVRMELHQLRCQRGELYEEIEKTRQELGEIRQKRERMKEQVEQLQQRMLVQASPIEAKATTETQGRKEELEKRSVSVQVEMSVQQALLETSLVESAKIRERQEEAEQSYLEAVLQTSQVQSQLGKARERCQQLESEVASKELEIQRLMSAIYTSKAQLTVMSMGSTEDIHTSKSPQPEVKQMNGSASDDDGDSNHSSLASDGERLSPRERVAQDLVEAVASHSQQWDRVQSAVREHQGLVSLLQGHQTQLNSEISQREARVIELEALLQARHLGDSIETARLSSAQTELALLRSSLRRTREEHVAACTEILMSLSESVAPWLKGLEMVKRQLSAKSRELEEAHAQREELQAEYAATCSLIDEAERDKLEASERWKMAVRELQEQRQAIEALENELAEEHRKHVDDVDQQAATIAELTQDLELLDLEQSSHSFELLTLASEKTALQEKLQERDRLQETLQQQTTQLVQDFEDAIIEAEARAEVVKGLETDLCVSQTLCDSLQQEAADGEEKITDLQQQLQESHRNQLELTQQMLKLQEEAEAACRELDAVLKQNSIPAPQGGTTIQTLETHLDAERSTTTRLRLRVAELLGSSKVQHKRIADLQEQVQRLDADNFHLRTERQWQSDTISSLKDQVAESVRKKETLLDTSTLERNEVHVVVENLQRLLQEKDEELTVYESQKRMLEALAQERLQEVIALQQQLYHAGSRDSHTTAKEKLDASASIHLSHDLQVDVESLHTMYEEKCVELQRLRNEHRLLMDKEAFIDQQLEECRKEVRLCKERALELEAKYIHAQDELAQCQTVLASYQELSTLQDSNALQDDQPGPGQEGKLRRQLNEARRKVEIGVSALAREEEGRLTLLHKLSALEERHQMLIRSHAQSKMDLNRVREQLRQERQTSREAHAGERLTQRQPMMALDEVLHILPGEQDGSEAGSAKSLPFLPPADESALMQNSLYQAVLEKGLSSGSALNTSGYVSPAERSDDLDKQYWIRRASELSVQLQGSSEFWAEKVRELSHQVEKFESGQK